MRHEGDVMTSPKTGAKVTVKDRLSGGPATAISPDSVQARAAELASALECGAGALPADGIERAQAAIAKTAARTSIVGGRTVVALAGATGGGKSSLFNALVGADVAQVGARRPTTATPTAAVWGEESAAPLLDWLMVGARHIVESPGPDLDGLVLLDLPDFDSEARAHRLEADRVLDLVDVFVWVTDPQKYADARLHEDYIARLSAHDAVTITVLNQADRLTPEALAACRADLVRLLGLDGVAEPELVATSAIAGTEGTGIDDLRHRIAAVVAERSASARRLDSDLRSAATVLRSGVADSEPSLEGFADTALVDALSRAAGIPVILGAVERDYRRESAILTGWPLTRWARALRPAPLKRLGLGKDVAGRPSGIGLSDVRSVLGRSSLPPATPAARSAVALAARELGDRAGRELPQPWTDEVTDAAIPPGGDLTDALDQAVVGTSLRTRDPVWWAIFGLLQWVFAAVAGVGLIWLVVLMVLGWLQLPTGDTPTLGPLPDPFLLFAGGLFVGFLLSLLTRTLARVGGRRRKARIASRLRKAVAQVAQDRLVAPVRDVLDRHRMTREHLEAARRPSF
jgi:GTP-binding protein EngB required for normal cell division